MSGSDPETNVPGTGFAGDLGLDGAADAHAAPSEAAPVTAPAEPNATGELDIAGFWANARRQHEEAGAAQFSLFSCQPLLAGCDSTTPQDAVCEVAAAGQDAMPAAITESSFSAQPPQQHAGHEQADAQSYGTYSGHVKECGTIIRNAWATSRIWTKPKGTASQVRHWDHLLHEGLPL